jgi:hypothetical protein
VATIPLTIGSACVSETYRRWFDSTRRGQILEAESVWCRGRVLSLGR